MNFEDEYGDIELCPHMLAKPCPKAGTSGCDSTCEFHPERVGTTEEIRKVFELNPGAIYCFSCESFIETRYFCSQQKHAIATGYLQFRELLPKYIASRLAARQMEVGDMEW